MNGAAGGLSQFEAEDSKKQKEEEDIFILTEEAEQYTNHNSVTMSETGFRLRSERDDNDVQLRLRNTRISDSASNFSLPKSPSRKTKTGERTTASPKKNSTSDSKVVS